MSAEKLMIGVPSKGRLQENTHAFFKRAGLELVRERGERDYRGGLKGFDAVEVQYLSASDIAGELARGGLHLGVTGEDLIRESIADADARITLLTPLGFGQANVVVAVPQAWIDVRCMADIEDVAADFHARKGSRMRVATKYLSLTRRHFAAHGVGDYRIVESLGATEGAPASGAAELIVDITTTGATLAANGLKIVDDGVILKSEANLVAARTADWSDAAKAAAKAILARIAAEETARTHPRGESPDGRRSRRAGARCCGAVRRAGSLRRRGAIRLAALRRRQGRGARRLADRGRREPGHGPNARLYLYGEERALR